MILAMPAAAQPGRDSSIAGQVLNATTGAPLNRATVEIEVEGHPDIRGMAPTTADGQFRLRALPPGRYLITVSKSGYASMNYGARYPGAPGQVVTVGAHENKSGLLIRLPRYGSISGTIIDASGGNARGTYVVAWRQEFPRGKPGWTQAGGSPTNDQGQYRIANLLPGRYVVAANPVQQGYRGPRRPRTREEAELLPQSAQTFHPSSLTAQEATPVDVGSGSVLRDVDITIQEIAPIRLSIRIQPPPDMPLPPAPADGSRPAPPFYAPVWILPQDGGPAGSLQAIGATSESRQEARALSPGRYLLVSVMESDGRCYAARREVPLFGGSLNLTLPLTPCIDLAGHVRILGPASQLSSMRVTLSTGDSTPTGTRSAEVRPDGSFVVRNVPPGIWDISPDPIPPGGFLKSMRLGQEDVLTRDMLITPETNQPLEIEISTRAAQLSGHVENGYATTILAAPEGDLASVLSFYATTGVDENGAFHFPALTPGAYRIYAFEDMRPQAWFDPEFLKNYPGAGTSVDLAEGAHPDIKVDAIPGAAQKRAR